MSDRGSEIIGRSYRQAGPAIRRGRYRPGNTARAESALAWRTLVGVLEMTPDVVAVVTRQGATGPFLNFQSVSHNGKGQFSCEPLQLFP